MGTWETWCRGLGVTLALSLMAMMGCGGGDNNGGPGDPGDPGTPGELTEAQRHAVLDQVSERFGTLVDLPAPQANQQLADWMDQQPLFEAVGISEDSCVWARFTDGTPLIVVNNREPADAMGDQRAYEAVTTRAAQELPLAGRARLMNGMGTCFQTPIAELSRYLTNRGYAVTTPEPTVEALKQVSGDGVFFLDAHGGMGDLKGIGQAFSLWTATQATTANDRLYRDDLKQGRLAYMVATHDRLPGGKCSTPKHYAITPAFVRKYMSLGQDSFVYISACTSDNADMKAAFFNRGASLYAGWSLPVFDSHANLVAKFIFDRLLGTNDNLPLERPDQRAFDHGSVYQDLVHRGYHQQRDAERGLTTQFVFTTNPNDADPMTVLAPTIKFMDVNEGQSQLILHGIFGSDPGAEGKVECGGQQLTVVEWKPDQITCRLPVSGAGSHGDVRVTVRGHRGNDRQLTSWMGYFHYLVDAPGSLEQRWNMELHLRADLGSYRENAGMAPVWREVRGVPALDSGGEWLVGGEAKVMYLDGSHHDLERWSGNGVLEVWGVTDGPVPNAWFVGLTRFVPKDKRLFLRLTGTLMQQPDIYSQWYCYVCNPPQELSHYEGKMSAFLPASPPGELPSDEQIQNIGSMPMDLPITLDSNWNIVAGERKRSGVLLTDNVGTNHIDDLPSQITIKWPTIAAQSPPKPDTARAR